MIAYIFDTGVILRTFFPPDRFTGDEKRSALAKQRIERIILPQWVTSQASLIVPNFVVAETLKIFAEYFLSDESKTFKERYSSYEEAKDVLINWISYKPVFNESRKPDEENKFFNYELNRHHLLNLDKIFEYDFKTIPIEVDEKRRPRVLSSTDALIISVGVELRRLFGLKNVFILTLDKRMQKVCARNNPDLPSAIYVADERCKETELFPQVKGESVHYLSKKAL